MNYLINSSFKRMTGIDFVNSAAANWRFIFDATAWWRNGGSSPAEKAVRN